MTALTLDEFSRRLHVALAASGIPDLVSLGESNEVVGTTYAARVADAIADFILMKGTTAGLLELLAVMELGISQGEQGVADIVATGFVEALLTRSDRDPSGLQVLMKALGPSSRCYGRSWDEFTGARTLGLWTSTGENYGAGHV